MGHDSEVDAWMQFAKGFAKLLVPGDGQLSAWAADLAGSLQRLTSRL